MLIDVPPPLQQFLKDTGVTVTAQPQDHRQRYWKAVGRWRSQDVFIKAALTRELSASLERESTIAKEIRLTEIPTTAPICAARIADAFVIIYEYEIGADRPRRSEERAAAFGRAEASAVAKILARLVGLTPHDVPSASFSTAPPAEAVRFQSTVRAHLAAEGSKRNRRTQLEAEIYEGTGLERKLADLAAALPHSTASKRPIFLHGDASPANTLFRPSGDAALFDWEWARFEGCETPWIAYDVMNYITRSWANAEFARALLAEYRELIGDADLISFRVCLVLQTLNKLRPSYLYPEMKWQATATRFAAWKRLFRLAIDASDDMLLRL